MTKRETRSGEEGRKEWITLLGTLKSRIKEPGFSREKERPSKEAQRRKVASVTEALRRRSPAGAAESVAEADAAADLSVPYLPFSITFILSSFALPLCRPSALSPFNIYFYYLLCTGSAAPPAFGYLDWNK